MYAVSPLLDLISLQYPSKRFSLRWEKEALAYHRKYIHCLAACSQSIPSECNSYLWLSTCIVDTYAAGMDKAYLWIIRWNLCQTAELGKFTSEKTAREPLPNITHAMCIYTRSTHSFPFSSRFIVHSISY